ncbi:hypothetical protein ACLNGM_09985 [Aureimonas phyllosphaerae]|uniref:hypothetical protein n=1 Tax=Aureimonas phyllosphaerae TaxID=1166078 RepID=UPI003A5C5FBC
MTTLEARRVRLGPGLYRWPAGGALTAVERRTVLGELADLRGLLRTTVPGDGGMIVEEVADQICASFAKKEGGNDDAVYDGFLIALPGRSCAAVREAVRRLIRSEAPKKYSRKWRPEPAELAELTQAIETEWTVAEQRLLRLLELEEEARVEPEPQPSAEEMAAVRERVKRLTAGVAKRRFVRKPADDPQARARETIAEVEAGSQAT